MKKELEINIKLKQQISYKIRITTGIILILLAVGTIISKGIGYFSPTVKKHTDIQNDINSSKYVAFGAINCEDDMDSLVNPDTESILLSKGIDQNNWNRANRWIKDLIVRTYLDDSSMENANERLSMLVEASTPTTCKILNIIPDENGVYPASKEIREADIAAIQVCDIYIPTNTSVALEDLTEVILQSKANVKLVEVKTKERGTEDPSYSSCWEDVRYIVYKDTPENRYEEDYIVKLRVDQFGLTNVYKALVTYISKVDSVNEDAADMVYLSGGATARKASIITKAKMSLSCFEGYIQGWISSATMLSTALLILLVCFAVIILLVIAVFPPALIVVYFAFEIVMIGFYLLCAIVSFTVKLFCKLFQKPAYA